jgi:uncharacterized protein (TIGR03083 family)
VTCLTGMLGHDRYHRELVAEARRFADAVHGADLDQRVPTCPEWTLGQLTRHLGRGHRWAAAMVERRSAEPLPAGDVDDARPPDGPDGRAGWLLAGAERLASAVREAGPGTPVWTWSHDRTAGFWLRRMAHESLLHRVDAELAAGRAVEMAPDMAADSVSDLLWTFTDLPARFPGLGGEGETLHLHATDEGLGEAGEWLVRRTPEGVAWEHAHRRGDVAVRGRAADLMLVLWRRAAPDPSRVEILGDEGLLAHWLEHSAF